MMKKCAETIACISLKCTNNKFFWQAEISLFSS